MTENFAYPNSKVTTVDRSLDHINVKLLKQAYYISNYTTFGNKIKYVHENKTKSS